MYTFFAIARDVRQVRGADDAVADVVVVVVVVACRMEVLKTRGCVAETASRVLRLPVALRPPATAGFFGFRRLQKNRSSIERPPY